MRSRRRVTRDLRSYRVSVPSRDLEKAAARARLIPAPVLVGGRKAWQRADIVAWLESRG